MNNLFLAETTINDVVAEFSEFINKIFHQDNPAVDIVSALIQLCATAIIFIVVAKFVFKPIREILAKRSEHIASEMKEAEEAKARSLEYEQTAKGSIDLAKEESKQIVQDAKIQAEATKEKALAQLDEEIAARKQRAEEEIEQEKAAASEEVRKQIIDVALQASEAVLNREINEKDNSRLVDDFVKDMVN